MHPDILAKFHEVRHRSRRVAKPRGDVGARGGVWIDNSAVRIADQTEVSGPVIRVFADDLETTDRGSPSLFTGGNRRDQSDSPIFQQVSRLLGKTNNHRSL